ncbi:hypothetical protein HK104_008655 [Borealophlyctis nickersoniae]|nr:hypothetical protein HK104_008655 [Borealophlyctis nickersoniae]
MNGHLSEDTYKEQLPSTPENRPSKRKPSSALPARTFPPSPSRRRSARETAYTPSRASILGTRSDTNSDTTYDPPSSDGSEQESDDEDENLDDGEELCLDFISGLPAPDVTDPEDTLSAWRKDAWDRASQGELKFTRDDMFDIALLHNIILDDCQYIPANRGQKLKTLIENEETLLNGDDAPNADDDDDDEDNNLRAVPATAIERSTQVALKMLNLYDRKGKEIALRALRNLLHELEKEDKLEKEGKEDKEDEITLLEIAFELFMGIPKNEPLAKQDEIDYMFSSVAPFFKLLEMKDSISLKWNSPSSESGNRKKRIDRSLQPRRPDLTIIKSGMVVARAEIKTPSASRQRPASTCYDCFRLMQFLLEDNGVGIQIFGSMLFLYKLEPFKDHWHRMRRLTSVPIPRVSRDIPSTISSLGGFLRFLNEVKSFTVTQSEDQAKNAKLLIQTPQKLEKKVLRRLKGLTE